MGLVLQIRLADDDGRRGLRLEAQLPVPDHVLVLARSSYALDNPTGATAAEVYDCFHVFPFFMSGELVFFLVHALCLASF